MSKPSESTTAAADLSVEEQIILQARSNYEPLPMLEALFDRLSLPLAEALKDYIGVDAEVAIKSFTYTSCAEALAGFSPQDLPLVAKADPWHGSIAVLVSPELLFSALQIMLGGRSAAEKAWTPRSFTRIEKRVGAKLCDIVLNELSGNFADLTPVSFTIDRQEDSPQAMLLAPPESPCVSITLEVDLHGRKGGLSFMIPNITFETVHPIFAQPFLGGEIGSKNSWRGLLSDSLQDTSVTLTAVMRELTQPLANILSWKTGQVLDLGIDTDQDVQVSCSDKNMFMAAMGRRKNGSVALRITENLSEGLSSASRNSGSGAAQNWAKLDGVEQ